MTGEGIPQVRFSAGDRSEGAAAAEGEQDAEDEEEKEESEEVEAEEDPWKNVPVAALAAAIDRALIKDEDAAPHAMVCQPIRDVSLRSVLLAVLPGDEDTQVRAGEWFYNMGVEQTFFRLAGTSPKGVVHCCVSSSMVSGCWGVAEFRLGDRGYLYYSPDEGEHESVLGAWEPAENAAARRTCILSVYAREWRERVLPPAMGEWATGDPGLLQEAILRVRLSRAVRKAQFPFLRTIEEFNFSFQTALRLQMLGSYLGPELAWSSAFPTRGVAEVRSPTRQVLRVPQS